MAYIHQDIARLTWPQFVTISRLMKERFGLNLHRGKMALVQARLQKRLRALNLGSFRQYVDRIRADHNGAETTMMIDALSTNVTCFFRESRHFDYLRSTILPRMLDAHSRDRRMRIWSAGCSSGEEPYSIAMLLLEALGDLDGWDPRILATDVSRHMLAIARQGTYNPEQLQQIPLPLIHRCFTRRKDDHGVHYEIAKTVRRLVDCAYLNLMDHWPMQGPFDVIFCRNVMIYFDKSTQQRLAERFWDILAPGGTLFIGHSESFAGVQHRFRYVEPAIYEKASAEK